MSIVIVLKGKKDGPNMVMGVYKTRKRAFNAMLNMMAVGDWRPDGPTVWTNGKEYLLYQWWQVK